MSQNVGINVKVPIMPKNGGPSPVMQRRDIPVRSPFSDQSTTSSIGSYGSHNSESPLLFQDSNYINVGNELRQENVLDNCSTMSLNFDDMVLAKSNLTHRQSFDATVGTNKYNDRDRSRDRSLRNENSSYL